MPIPISGPVVQCKVHVLGDPTTQVLVGSPNMTIAFGEESIAMYKPAQAVSETPLAIPLRKPCCGRQGFERVRPRSQDCNLHTKDVLGVAVGEDDCLHQTVRTRPFESLDPGGYASLTKPHLLETWLRDFLNDVSERRVSFPMVPLFTHN